MQMGINNKNNRKQFDFIMLISEQFPNPTKQLRLSNESNGYLVRLLYKLTQWKCTALFLSVFFIVAHGPPKISSSFY